MSGNSAVRSTFEDLLETLGRMTESPRAALAEVADGGRYRSGALVMALAVFGRVVAGPLPWEGGAAAWLRSAAGGWAGGMALWGLLTVLVHGVSRAAGRRGSLEGFLAVTGWAGAALWLELPFRLLGAAYPQIALLAGAPRVACRAAAFLVWWWGLRRVYGWSSAGALALLLLPALAVGALLFALGLAAAVFFAGSASLFHALAR